MFMNVEELEPLWAAGEAANQLGHHRAALVGRLSGWPTEEGKKLTPTGCPLTSTHTKAHLCVHTHT